MGLVTTLRSVSSSSSSRSSSISFVMPFVECDITLTSFHFVAFLLSPWMRFFVFFFFSSSVLSKSNLSVLLSHAGPVCDFLYVFAPCRELPWFFYLFFHFHHISLRVVLLQAPGVSVFPYLSLSSYSSSSMPGVFYQVFFRVKLSSSSSFSLYDCLVVFPWRQSGSLI